MIVAAETALCKSFRSWEKLMKFVERAAAYTPSRTV